MKKIIIIISIIIITSIMVFLGFYLYNAGNVINLDDVESITVKLTDVRINDIYYSDIEFVVTDYDDIKTIYEVDKAAKSSKNVTGINLAPWTATFEYNLVSGEVVHEYCKIGNDTFIFENCLSYINDKTEN